MALTGNSEDPKKELIKHLEKYTVPAECIAFITVDTPETLGFASISDFASAFTEADYAEGVKAKIAEKVPSAKDDIRAISRLRTAWKMASAELSKAVKRRIEGAPEADWDQPLDDTIELQRQQDFQAAYGGLVFDTESTPGSNIIGRMFREFRSQQKQITLTSLHKMRSEADYKQLGTVKRQQLADGLALIQDGNPTLPDIHFTGMLQLFEALKLLTNGWALTGYGKVESKLEFDQASGKFMQVANCHLTQAIAYFDFVFRKAAEHKGSDDAKIRWLLERDRQTRAKAKNLYSQGWPWGEAICESKDKHCLVLWTLGHQGANGAQPLAVLPQMSRQTWQDKKAGGDTGNGGSATKNADKKKKKKTKAGANLAKVCPKHNTPGGCTRQQKDCPQGLKHVCGKCGMFNHKTNACRS